LAWAVVPSTFLSLHVRIEYFGVHVRHPQSKRNILINIKITTVTLQKRKIYKIQEEINAVHKG